MNKPSPRLLKSLLLYLLLIVFATVTVRGFHVQHAQSLSSEAYDFAQIAHHINDGHGFSTDVIRNIGAAAYYGPPAGKYMPEVRHAPLYPTLLAGAFSIGGINDGTIIAFSNVLFVLSAVLLFALTKRLLNQVMVPFLTTVAYIASVTILAAGNAGRPPILGACLLLALLLVLTPKNEAIELAKLEAEPDAKLSRTARKKLGRQYFVIGLLAGLCFLNDYTSLLYVLPLIFLWSTETRPLSWNTALNLAIGFLILALPWWMRNQRVAGNPLASQELLMLTGQIDDTHGALLNARTWITTFLSFAASVPHLLLVPFIFISIWIRPTTQPMARRKMAILVAFACSALGLSALLREGGIETVPLAPLLAFVGITTFQQLVSYSWFSNGVSKKIASPYRFEPVPDEPNVLKAQVTKRFSAWRFYAFKFWLLDKLRVPMMLRTENGEEILYGGKWPMRTLYEFRATVLLILALFVPLVFQMALAKKMVPGDLHAAIKPLVNAVPQDHFIISDVPEAVSWYANRRSLPLPQRASLVMEMDNTGVGAIYLADPTTTQRLPEWTPLYNRAQVPGYQGVNLQENKERPDVYYIKQLSVEEARTRIKKDPKNTEGYLALGWSSLYKKDGQNAFTAFAKAQRQLPNNAEAFVGGGIASSLLGDDEEAKHQYERALVLFPRSVQANRGLGIIEQTNKNFGPAITLYEKVLAETPNDVMTLNNLAQLYADQGTNLYRALEMARRAVAANPRNPYIIDTLGWTCHRIGYHKEAVEYLKIAAKEAPNDKGIQEHLAQAIAAK